MTRDAAGDAPRDAPGEPMRDAASEGARDAPKEVGEDVRGEVGPGDAPKDGARDAGEREVAGGRAPRAGDLAIDEVLVDPAGNDLGHEWLELANLTDEALDLSALHLSDGATDVAVDAGVLAPRGVVVLGQSADRAHNGDAPVDFAYGTRLQLTNGADRIALCAGPCADGATLVVFEWTAAFGDAYAGHAVVVAPGAGATCPATEAYGTGGNFGTPGRPNPPCAPRDGGSD